MTRHRGDVVLLDYPFSDSSGSKIRPALIIQADARNALITHTIVAMILENDWRPSFGHAAVSGDPRRARSLSNRLQNSFFND